MKTTKSFEAVAQRSGNWWALEVPALPGVFTQARSLALADEMVRDAVAVFLEVPSTSISVSVRVLPPTAAKSVVEQALSLKAEAEKAQAAASAAMREAVVALEKSGLTNRDAGRILQVSHQRIAQVAGRRSRVAVASRVRRRVNA